MTQAQERTTPLDQQDERVTRAAGLRETLTSATSRVRGGDIGSLPLVVGIVLIFAIFQSLNSAFLSPASLVDLAGDCVAVGVIAIGIVLVLLVGQIDLSVGSMSGVGSTILGVGLVLHGWSEWEAICTALAAGLVVGTVYGMVFVRLSVPSFVITLAGLLALLGLQLQLLGANGSINIPFNSFVVKFTQDMYVPPTVSYVLAAAAGIAYFGSALGRNRRRRANDLSVPTLIGAVVRSALLLAALEFVCWYLNKDAGVPDSFVMLVVLVVVMNYLLTRTLWGRSVFAVGGSLEGARRAGIKVNRIYMSVFALCAFFAALGGVLSAGRLASADISSGVGNVNLDAIAAAVIGGTSLFGGRGSAYSALLGIIVIQSIASGLTLMNLNSSVQYMITGGVLAVAVIVDSLARRSRAAHGRA
jgi:simple sugar transport system permease protein/D-xylose transport system permease protein